MLQAEILFAKIDYLWLMIESDSNKCLTNLSHLALYVPFILEEEMKEARFCSAIFDRNTHLAEALAILIRFVDSSWFL